MKSMLCCCALLAAMRAGAQPAAPDQDVDPELIRYVYVGDEADWSQPRSAGIAKIEVVGPTSREFDWGGGQRAAVPLTGLKKGAYVIRWRDRAGNVSEKRYNIIRFAAGPESPKDIPRSVGAKNVAGKIDPPDRTIEGPERCRILDFAFVTEGVDVRLLTTGDRSSCEWDLSSGKSWMTGIPEGYERIFPKRLGRGYLVHGRSQIGLYDPETKRLVPLTREATTEFSPSEVSVSKDGRSALVAGQEFLSRSDRNWRRNPLFLWPLDPPSAPILISTFSNLPRGTALSPDGTEVVASDYGFRVLKAPEWRTTQNLIWTGEGGVIASRFSADGRTLVVGTEDGVQLLRKDDAGKWHSAETLLRQGHGYAEFFVEFSPDESRLATFSWEGVLRVWDMRTRRLLWQKKAADSWPQALAFSVDGKKVYSSGFDGILRVWSVEKGRLELELRPKPEPEVR